MLEGYSVRTSPPKIVWGLVQCYATASCLNQMLRLMGWGGLDQGFANCCFGTPPDPTERVVRLEDLTTPQRKSYDRLLRLKDALKDAL
jgi:hypothetical protein